MVSIVTAPFLAAGLRRDPAPCSLNAAGPRLAAAFRARWADGPDELPGPVAPVRTRLHRPRVGLAGTVAPPVVVLIAVAIYSVQVAASAAWMARFPYGPTEWLLRAWTEQRWPRLRATDPA